MIIYTSDEDTIALLRAMKYKEVSNSESGVVKAFISDEIKNKNLSEFNKSKITLSKTMIF